MSIMPPLDRDEFAPHERHAEIVKKSEFVGTGALVQLVGVASLFIFPLAIGVITFLILLVVGGRMAIVRVCSECRGKVDRQASRCPHCRANLF
jgi:hypothetical protein